MKKESCDCVEREREEYKSGDMIKIPEEYQLLMRGHKQRIEACNTGIAALSAQLADAHREMWGFVEGMYPEFKRFSCQFDHVNMQVVLQRKLDDWEMSEWDKDKILYKLWKEDQNKETKVKNETKDSVNRLTETLTDLLKEEASVVKKDVL